MQVEPKKTMLKALGTKRLKLQCDELLSSCTFKFSLRRYTTEDGERLGRLARGGAPVEGVDDEEEMEEEEEEE